MHPRPRFTDPVAAPCPCTGAKGRWSAGNTPATTDASAAASSDAAASRLVRRTPRTSRRRCYEFFSRTLIYLSTGVSGGTGGTGSAVEDGRTLAAATEAARDVALIFFLLQRAHICIVVVSIVSTTVLDFISNTLLMRPIKKCCGGYFKTVRYVISPVTDTK
jgi:hypothetical protein